MTYERLDETAYRFPAVLKNMDGKVQETASATFYPESNSIEFENDFVPLFSMRTQLQIFRVQNEVEVQRFVGEVYLSSSNMLRLVSVTNQLLPEAVLICSYPVTLDAKVHAIIREKQPRGLFRKIKENKVSFPVNVQELSMNEIKFTTEQVLEQGQMITLTLVPPQVFNEVQLQIDLAMVFGQKLNSYRCRMVDLHSQNRTQIQTYLEGRSKRVDPIFPNEPGERLYQPPKEHLIEPMD